jgi:hypothetical protein
VARLNQFSFNGQLINSPNVRVGKIVGQFGLPQLRGSNWIAQNATGEQFVQKLHGGRDIILPLIVRDTPNGISQSIFDMISGWAATRTQSTLANILDTGTRTAMAECTGWTQTDMTSAGLTFAGLLTFHLADPWFYGPTVSGSVGLSSSPSFGAAVSSGALSGTSASVVVSGVISGQPIVAVTHTGSSNAASVSDNFSTPMTWTRIVSVGGSVNTNIWIGTGGVGTSGTITVTGAASAGIIAVPLAGCSTAAGASAVDTSGSASVAWGSPVTLSLTPSTSLALALYHSNNRPSDIVGWTPLGVLTSSGLNYYVNDGYAFPTVSVPLVGTFLNGLPSAAAGVGGIIVKAAVGAGTASLSITNPGTVVAEHLSLDILGQVINPTITNTTNGTSLTFTGTVAAGTHLIIDTGSYTALNDSANVIGSIRHAGATGFLTLAPGANTITVSGSLASASTLTVSFLPPYV